MRSRTSRRTSSPLAASRMAEVANAIISVTPKSSATSVAECTNDTRVLIPVREIRSPSPISSASRMSVLCECAGTGAAPWWASTTSRWTVLEPTSRTPRRTP